MAKLSLVKGTTSYIAQVFIQDSSSTTGAALTGIAFNTSGLTAYYHRDTDTTATAITLATMTVGTFTSSGFKEIDATNMPGWYQFCPPNAALASGAKSCAVHLKGVTNMAPLPLEIELTGWDNQDAVHGGMSALPNAAAEAAGGLYTRGTGAGQIKQTNNGEIDANATHVNNVATTSVTTVAAVVGTTIAPTFTSALMKVDVTDWAATAVSTPATAGIPEVNVKNINNVSAAAVTTVKAVQGLAVDGVVTTVTNQLTAAAIATGIWQDTTGADFTTASSIGKSLYTTGNAPGAASGIALVGSNMGTVSSVTGAVGSVTAGVSVGSGGIQSTSFAAASIDAAAIATDAIGSAELAATAVTKIAAGVFAFAFPAAYGSYTCQQILELIVASQAGKTSGAATTTFTIRNLADSADVIVATVDASGDRSAVTLTP